MKADSRVASPTWSRRFGEHIEATRVRALMSRAQLAARVGVSEETIRRWERGGARPTAEGLTRLIVVLSLDGAEFISMPEEKDELPPLARCLREERLARGISQAQAGQVLGGVSQPTYAGWEIGRATPTARWLTTIAAFLGMESAEVDSMVAAPFTVDTARWSPLGQLIGSRRQALRLTRGTLARELTVAPETVAAWEHGYRTPRPQQLSRLAAALDVQIEQLEAALPKLEQLTALGELIRSSQRRLGLRRRDIAERAGLDEATLSRWVHGRHVPELSSLRRLAAALEVPFPFLCTVAGVTA